MRKLIITAAMLASSHAFAFTMSETYGPNGDKSTTFTYNENDIAAQADLNAYYANLAAHSPRNCTVMTTNEGKTICVPDQGAVARK